MGWLDELCQMKIALKYAMALHTAGSMTEPPLETFKKGLAEIQIVNPAIDLQFRCGVCIQEGKVLVLINKADEKIREEKEEAREREAKIGDSIRKRPRLKNSVVMQARMAKDAFDELFPLVSGSSLPAEMEM